MVASRLIGIPMDHMVAELAAFPLASEAALELGLTTLDPTLGSPAPAGGDCRRLWREAERQFLGHFPAFSVDEAVAIRDSVWFGLGGGEPVPLHSYLRQLAASFLEARGPLAVPRLPPDQLTTRPADDIRDALARERWRWLALALPADLLLAALGTSRLGPERVELMSPLLDQQLRDRGYAETHLHLGAALDFPTLWASAMRALIEPGLMQPNDLGSPGAGLDEGRRLAPWLIRAAVARHLLAAFLVHGRWDEGFEAYLGTMLGRLIEHLHPANVARLRQGLAALRAGRLSALDCRADTHVVWKGLYAEIASLMGGGAAPGRGASASPTDPIEPLLARRRPGRGTAEIGFVATALAYLEYGAGDRREDGCFAQLFWQATRVRVLFYRHVVQRPMTPGLTWFVRFYGRMRPAGRHLTNRFQLESAASLGGEARGLSSLEVRTSPPSSNSVLRALSQDLEQAACAASRVGAEIGDAALRAGPVAADRRTEGGATGRNRRPWQPSLEMGVVFHFTKNRGGGTDQGHPTAHWHGSYADPRCAHGAGLASNPSGYRYAHYYLGKRVEANSLTWLLRHYPLVVEIFRGVDVCTDEIGVPNWVLTPLLAHVRAAGDAAAALLQRRYGLSPPGLRTTVHAGEDFVHLLTGLRQVDEAIDGFDLNAGDRIGHGIALGVDAREWARRAGRIPILCEERLFDLVWEWSWYGRGGRCADQGRHPYLDREIAVLSDRIFGRPVAPHALEMLRRDLHSPEALRAVGFPEGSSVDSLSLATIDPDTRAGRLYRYLTSPGLFRRGRAAIWVDPSADGEMLAHLQAELRRKVGARGLTVEVNPTSNLLIGNLGDLRSHPLWRLRPPRPGDDEPPVSICVGSDDPVVFGSNLRHEYQALYDAMLLAGLSDEEARQWLDRTRASSLETRFTLALRSGRSLFDAAAINLEELPIRLPP